MSNQQSPPEPPKDREIPSLSFSKRESIFIFLGLSIGIIGTMVVIVLSKMGLI